MNRRVRVVQQSVCWTCLGVDCCHLVQRTRMPELQSETAQISDTRGAGNSKLRCFAGAGSHAQNMTLEGLTRALGFILYGYCVFLFVFTAIMALSEPPYCSLP